MWNSIWHTSLAAIFFMQKKKKKEKSKSLTWHSWWDQSGNKRRQRAGERVTSTMTVYHFCFQMVSGVSVGRQEVLLEVHKLGFLYQVFATYRYDAWHWAVDDWDFNSHEVPRDSAGKKDWTIKSFCVSVRFSLHRQRLPWQYWMTDEGNGSEFISKVRECCKGHI